MKKKKLYTVAVLFFVVTGIFAQVPKVKGWGVTVRDQEGPQFEALRRAGTGFAPSVNYFMTDTDGSYIGGGSTGEVTLFVIRRPQGFKGSRVWMYVDTDNNVSTGRSSAHLVGRRLDLYEAYMGVDHMVDLSDASSGQARLYDAFGDFVANVPASTDGLSISVTIPVVLVGGDGNMGAMVVVNDDRGQNWIPNRGFLPVWEFNALIMPTSSPAPSFSLVLQDQSDLILVANNFAKLKLHGAVASFNGKDIPLELVSASSSSESEVYRIKDFGKMLTPGIFNPNRLSFGVLTERGFFSRTQYYIVFPSVK